MNAPPKPPSGPLPPDLLLAVLEQAPEALFIAEAGGALVYANPEACRLLGRDAKDLLAEGLEALRPDLPFEAWTTPAVETFLPDARGASIPVEMSLRVIRSGPRELRVYRVRDLTERRAAEAALHRSESRYALAFNASPDAINLTRLDDGSYLEVSRGFERLTGWTREEVLGRTALDLGIWATPADRQRMVALLKEKGEFDGELFTFRGRDGRLIKGMMSGRMVSLEGVPCLLTVTRDLTLQLDAQQALGSLTDLISSITVSVPAFISLLDPAGRMLFLNRLAAGFTLMDVIGMDFREGLAPETREAASTALERVISGSEREAYEGWGWGDNREPRWYRCVVAPMLESGKVVGAVLVSMDETEHRRTEAALHQSQKLEGLGVLAGGIAHDFNNLLTAIMGNLNLAQLKLPEASPALRHLEAVENTVLKAAELTRQMLAYSGKGRFSVKPQDLSAVVSELVHLLNVTVPKKATLDIRLQEGLPAIEGDVAQIQQVILNLVTNASEALEDRPGAIRVATWDEELDEEAIQAGFPAQSLAPGRHVVLEVEDTGVGMAPEVLARIFDPFFTTKVKGRGLGLSAMLGILRGHKAGIRIRSAPGQGSCFQVYFPASGVPLPPAKEAGPEPDQPLRGRVLLVDDEAVILESIGAALATLGLEVVPARDGQEALDRFREAPPDLVIMDLTMPRMDGATAFREMQGLAPAVPVILSSGYDRQALEEARPAAFVQKPYRFKELSGIVREVMARKRVSAK